MSNNLLNNLISTFNPIKNNTIEWEQKARTDPNIKLWYNYIYHNPLNYCKLPLRVKNNINIINLASINKKFWIFISKSRL